MHPERLKGVVLLAAQTVRSQAYIQIMVASGLLPEKVIFMGEPKETPQVEKPITKFWNNILLANLNESVPETCKRAGIDLIYITGNDVNAEITHQAIRAVAPNLIIYSGISGQIVSERTLTLGPKFLHMHSGWLPDYRGSTTVYYTLLDGDFPGVSAIILDCNIDTGPIVARRKYPQPPINVDIDRVYDSAIRADLMINVLIKYKESGEISIIEEQKKTSETPYYVIHPILKNISILSLKKE